MNVANENSMLLVHGEADNKTELSLQTERYFKH
jgi:hypothetical protein